MKTTWSCIAASVPTAAPAVSVVRRALRHCLPLPALGGLLALLTIGLTGAVRFDAAAPQNVAIGNPAAVYCAAVMGFDYEIVTVGNGDDADDAERGICTLPGGLACDEWDFYSGLCGQDHSYCARQGQRTEVRRDGQDPFAPNYAVCVSPAGERLGSVVQLSALSSHLATACPPQVLDLQTLELTEPLWIDDESDLPSSFDWRNYQGANWMTSVKNQGWCGSCWAFSAVGVVEAHYNIIYNRPDLNLNLSEQDLLSCSGAGSCGGGHSGPALAYMQRTGVVDDGCMPYTALDLPCAKCAGWENRLILVDERAQFIPNLISLRRRLLNYGPIWVYMGISDV
jgi:putative hemolysin